MSVYPMTRSIIVQAEKFVEEICSYMAMYTLVVQEHEFPYYDRGQVVEAAGI